MIYGIRHVTSITKLELIGRNSGEFFCEFH